MLTTSLLALYFDFIQCSCVLINILDGLCYAVIFKFMYEDHHLKWRLYMRSRIGRITFRFERTNKNVDLNWKNYIFNNKNA